MSFGEAVGYLLIGNPISQALINTTAVIGQKAGIVQKKVPVTTVAPTAPAVPPKLSELSGSAYSFIRLAGFSGATAVILGAYGKHSLAKIIDPKEQAEAKVVFETANRFHFLHSFALLAIPLSRKPFVTGALMAAGTVLFSGTMYYRALSGDKTFVPVATFGGFCLIAAWLSLIF